jgi:hypothetical protein
MRRCARLSKNELRPHLVKGWVIPPKQNARFVWRMEEVLDLYEEPHDPRRPVVGFDERPCQLLAEVREPLPVGPGRPERRDHEYERGGMANVLMAFEPLAGRREIEVTKRRRGKEFAEMVGHLAEEVYPEAEKVCGWFATTFPPTRRPPSTRPSPPSGRGAWRGGWISSTHRFTALG